jgi:hypothetical protein
VQFFIFYFLEKENKIWEWPKIGLWQLPPSLQCLRSKGFA